ncbi:MAG: alpha/beta hydrolase family protein [Candidatus Limisoma sp.]
MKRITFIAAALVALSASAADFAGSWIGKLSFAGNSLRLVFELTATDDGYVCSFGSPDQGASGLEAKATADGNAIAINIDRIGATYVGELRNDTIFGKYTQAGHDFPMNLVRGKIEYNRPQTPQPPFDYEAREMTIDAADATLAGTLTYPVGYKKKNRPIAVVMVSGSGQQNRDEELMGHHPMAVIADHLAKNGVASLRYDDRGMAQSTGNPATVTVESNTADALAAVEALRKTGEFSKIGILGHSEGGLIGYLLAADAKVDFVVSLAGPAFSGRDVLIIQNKAMLTAMGVPDSFAEQYCTVMNEVLTMRAVPAKFMPRERSAVEMAAQSKGITLPDPLIENLTAVLKQDSPWLDSFIAADPTDALKAIRCPVFVAIGLRDLNVDPDHNVKALSALPDGVATIKTYDRLSHYMHPCKTGTVNEYGKSETTIDTTLLTDITDWIKSLNK